MAEIEEMRDEITKHFKNFKAFEVVRDPSDHHFMKQSKKPKAEAAKAIFNEYTILEQLPSETSSMIFVRAYEDHIDLMRAVIVGPQGTPYADALFFFDILFPQDYPSYPPNLYFHSYYGLHFNPNLLYPNNNQSWLPKKSSMLQLLLSIQALVLNEQGPYYFNEPEPDLWRRLFSSTKKSSCLDQYNKDVFRLCCKAMPRVMRNPPMHFECFVLGYFRENAYKILMNCGEYMNKYDVDLVEVMRLLIDKFEKNGSYCKHLYYLVDEADQKISKIDGGEKKAIAQGDDQSSLLINKWWKKFVNGFKFNDLFC
ncbi:hypothetical protein Scep_008850 [Stephania cephalantha]|uniref:UBC core domain-containing protein n=1 Tax=Stephania cephalantha TaxID=152367 RepID=A0AAP0JSK8_9MAGN